MVLTSEQRKHDFDERLSSMRWVMMQSAINDYRRARGKGAIQWFDGLVSHYCTEHCWAMARAGHLYHAENHYLNGWGEAIFMADYNGEDIYSYGKQILFGCFDLSPGHRGIVLDSNELAFGYIVHDWKIWICVRGR